MEPIEDLAREAAYFARAENSPEVRSQHVERALSERILRLNFIEEEIRRLIAERVLVVELRGRASVRSMASRSSTSAVTLSAAPRGSPRPWRWGRRG